MERLSAFWRALGANVELMDERHHDLVLAVTSHLPHLIAYNIVGTAADLEEVTEGEVMKYSAGGFRDFTRIAASDPVMWRDVFLLNKDAVLEILGRFTEDLQALSRAIRWGEGEKLEALFTRTCAIRRGEHLRSSRTFFAGCALRQFGLLRPRASTAPPSGRRCAPCCRRSRTSTSSTSAAASAGSAAGPQPARRRVAGAWASVPGPRTCLPARRRPRRPDPVGCATPRPTSSSLTSCPRHAFDLAQQFAGAALRRRMPARLVVGAAARRRCRVAPPSSSRPSTRPTWLPSRPGVVHCCRTVAGYWPLDQYLVEGPRTTDWLAAGVIKHHRTLGTTLNLLIGHGFTPTHVEEFCPTSAQIAARPELAGDERERPMFLLVSARRGQRPRPNARQLTLPEIRGDLLPALRWEEECRDQTGRPRLWPGRGVALGLVGLAFGDFASVWQPVPKDVPERTALAYLVAALLLALGFAVN